MHQIKLVDQAVNSRVNKIIGKHKHLIALYFHVVFMDHVLSYHPCSYT